MTKQKKCQCCEQKRYEADFTVCRTCYQDKGESMDNTNGPTVINGLLAYVSTYQHRSSNFQLKIAISAHYQENDIEDAKKDLIKGLEGLNLPLGDNVKERQNSANRSAKEAAIDDILNIFRICDQHELNNGPIYCAKDLSKLPPAPPEASGSMLSVFDILSKQEQQITALYTALTEVRAEIADMKAKPAAMSFSSMPHHSSPSYAAIATENSRNTQPTPRLHWQPKVLIYNFWVINDQLISKKQAGHKLLLFPGRFQTRNCATTPSDTSYHADWHINLKSAPPPQVPATLPTTRKLETLSQY